jgi:anti-sigma regulatory factor (Ser/Thr protein kinase)
MSTTELMRETPTQARFVVKDQSFVGATRRGIRTLAEHAGLTGEPLGRLDIITTELATNLAKHADGGGEIIAIESSTQDNVGINLISLDRGPGISNIEEVLLDGFSTTGTMGGGLGAIKRQSDLFEINSIPDKGTAIHCIVSQSPDRSKNPYPIEIGAISLPHPGETDCGDAIAAASRDDLTSILVVDGLGHGPGAAEAANKAVQVFNKTPFDDPAHTVEKIHIELAGTRGAAIALVHIHLSTNQVDFVGVGNIACRVYSNYSSKGCASVQGIVGGRIGSLKQYSYDWAPEAGLLMYSDGIKSAASLRASKSTSAILEAAEIYRDYCRITDDSTVVVVRDKRRK